MHRPAFTRVRTLDCLNYTRQQRRARLSENKQAINQDKPLLEVSHTDYSEGTDEHNSALQLEV